MSGRQIRSIIDSRCTADEQTVICDGPDARGQRVDTGIHWMQLNAASDYTFSRRIIRMR